MAAGVLAAVETFSKGVAQFDDITLMVLETFRKTHKKSNFMEISMKEQKRTALRIGATFWGARGSLPATITKEQIKDKIFQVLTRTRGINLDTDEAISSFVETLPFSLWSTYGCNTSCVEIREAEHYILCDAGTGIRDFGRFVMKQQKAAGGNIFHLFISHLHWDHIQGFPFFTPAYIPGNQINIYGGHERLEEAFIRQQESISFPVPLDGMAADIRFTVIETDREYEIGGLKVRAIEQDHPGGSFSYRFSRQDKAIVYSTDSEHKTEDEEGKNIYLEFIRDADLLIFDAQYSLLDAMSTKENWGHSSNLLGVELAVEANVKRLVLFHNEHTCEDEQLEQFLEDTRQYLKIYDESSPLKIDLAYDGMDIEV